ncbi:MAG: ClpXP protease specificity-enhancing factor SspB, partial [Myxococcota bacterium]
MEGVRAALPPKKDVARGLMLRGWLYVHLDPRRFGVIVPAWLRKQPQLVLQVGLDMPVPIPDLKVDDQGVSGTLSFNRSPFHIRVPWDAVYALVSEDGPMMVWPDSLPGELREEVEREMGQRAPAGLTPEDVPDAPDAPDASAGTEGLHVLPPADTAAAESTAPESAAAESAAAESAAAESAAPASAARPPPPPAIHRGEGARRAWSGR